MVMRIRMKVGVCLNKSHEAMHAHTNCNAQHISSALYKSFITHLCTHTQHACKMKYMVSYICTYIVATCMFNQVPK